MRVRQQSQVFPADQRGNGEIKIHCDDDPAEGEERIFPHPAAFAHKE